ACLKEGHFSGRGRTMRPINLADFTHYGIHLYMKRATSQKREFRHRAFKLHDMTIARLTAVCEKLGVKSTAEVVRRVNDEAYRKQFGRRGTIPDPPEAHWGRPSKQGS